jgi:hypothetical protein
MVLPIQGDPGDVPGMIPDTPARPIDCDRLFERVTTATIH